MFVQWKTLDNLDEIQKKLFSLYDNFENVRRLIRDMSKKSNVPIEPSEQTKLLAACMDCPGVIMAGVPGGNVQFQPPSAVSKSLLTF
jgi:phosphomevalonate kinase